jgi:hypothetical protein
MNRYRQHWYTVGLFIGIGVLVLVAIGWQSLEVLQRLLLLNFATLLFHQFEEYGWVGVSDGVHRIVHANDDLRVVGEERFSYVFADVEMKRFNVNAKLARIAGK